jgi:hypothetical protein
MNTSTNTNRAHDVTVIGFLRHCLAGALLAMGFVATGFGFAAMAHADDAPPVPNIQVPAPALIAPWLPYADPGCWRQLYFFNGRVHCG